MKNDVPDLEFLLADDFAGRQETSPILLVIRGLLLLGAGAFVVAALIHSEGFAHPEAVIVESVSLLVLAFGLALTWVYPTSFLAKAVSAPCGEASSSRTVK